METETEFEKWLFNRVVEITKKYAENIKEQKLQKCAKCGALYPESQYDCGSCGYSSGGD